MSENRLRFEKSPYLLQHQDNPVHWQAWGEEAFKAAREQNKPIFLSIGYSTCHWCHVMEHESFEKQEVAEVLNQNFISIKLDREERPDIDEIYMAAVQGMRQRGGWPLSMFLTPDLKPFYGGTYFPKEHFIALLNQLSKLWRESPEKIRDSGESVVEYLKEQKGAQLEPVGLDEAVFSAFFRNSLVNFDRSWGGFGAAPKFPHAMQLSLLLRIHRRSGDPEALRMVEFTLDKMARGGIYDHLGYGFARYSTDERWLVPHFEKMLYDNALLIVSYLEAYRTDKKTMFRQVARECLDYVLRMMTHPEGGFYSAEDADSEGEEGKFYVWPFEELREDLSQEEFDLVSKVYQVSPQGNFEGTNILWLSPEYGWEAKDLPLLKSARDKLFRLREARVHPHKDDKILTSWNGLMIRAMAMGYQVLGEEKYLQAANRAADFIKGKLYANGQLLARYRDGEGRFPGRLEDYAYLIQALLDLYQCDFNPKTLQWAMELQKLQDEKFLDARTGAYFFTDGSDPSLLVRSQEGMDGALPNANAVSALNLLRLGDLTFEPECRGRAEKIFAAFSRLLAEYPQAFAQMLIAYDYATDVSKELAILEAQDQKAADFLQGFWKEFIPNAVVAKGKDGASFPKLLEGRTAMEKKTTFYICQERTCERPIQNELEALKRIGEIKKYSL